MSTLFNIKKKKKEKKDMYIIYTVHGKSSVMETNDRVWYG